MQVTFTNDFFQVIVPTFWLLSTLALIYDRYFLLKQRIIDQMIAKAKKEGRCVICERPMKIISADE